ncbi:MAG: hypothetical protein AAGA65_09060, partial [Actinomycetota bacterium]
IEIDSHNAGDLYDRLQGLLYKIDMAGPAGSPPIDLTSSSGYHVTTTEADEWVERKHYDDALIAWNRARRTEDSAPYD